MNTIRTILSWAIVLIVASGGAAPAVAQDSDASGEKSDEAERAKKAKKAFDAGMEHYVDGDYSKAIVDFKRANNLYPSALLSYNIALARMHQGKITKARKAAEAALEFEGENLDDESRTKVEAILAATDSIGAVRAQIDRQTAKASAQASKTGDQVFERADRISQKAAAAAQKKARAAKHGETSTDTGRADGTSRGLGAVGWTGVVAGGLGAAGLVGVPILANKYDREVRKLEKLSTDPNRQKFQDQQSRVAAIRRNGRLLLYTGSALAVVGGGLVALDLWGLNQKNSEGQRVSAGVSASGQIRLDIRW